MRVIDEDRRRWIKNLEKERSGWVDQWIKKARQHAEIPNARKLLALVEEKR